VILWYLAVSVVLVFVVFQSSGIDFRCVALGAIAPLVLDAPFGHMAYAHTLLAPVVALVVVMAATAGRGRRLLRRRLIGVPIGWFCGLILSGAFMHTAVFWWPTAGDLGAVPLLPSWPWILGRELIGAGALAWCWATFGLADEERRNRFVRTGRLDVVPLESSC